MRQNWFLAFIFLLYIYPFVPVRGQKETQANDKYTLLTIPYNKRPLSLYSGQFQANGGYKFSVRTHSFDTDGEKISLKEDGKASILHYYYFGLRYGVNDFIEVGAESNYIRNGIRTESVSYFSGSDVISVNTLNENKGMGDILISTTLRLPFEYKWFDFGLKGAISLPTARFKPLQPTHTITDSTAANSFTVNYQFNNTNGNGVVLLLVLAEAKFSYSKFSVETSGAYREPVKEGKSIRWGQTLYGSKFSYYSKPYQYLLSRSLMFNFSIHYQAAGWFDIRMNGSYLKSDGGWTEAWGNKYANPEISLFALEPGFEIQISPSLKVYQVAGFPLTGKSTEASFYMFTTFSLNMFPFLR